jgi:hypothetical protein
MEQLWTAVDEAAMVEAEQEREQARMDAIDVDGAETGSGEASGAMAAASPPGVWIHQGARTTDVPPPPETAIECGLGRTSSCSPQKIWRETVAATGTCGREASRTC